MDIQKIISLRKELISLDSETEAIVTKIKNRNVIKYTSLIGIFIMLLLIKVSYDLYALKEVNVWLEQIDKN